MYARKLGMASKSKRLRMEETNPHDQSTANTVVQRHPNTSLNDSLDSSKNSGDTTPLLNEGNSSAYGATPLSKSKEASSFVSKSPNTGSQNLTESQEERAPEKNPLIQRETSPESEAFSYSMELPANSSGLWYKDKSGQHLMRFIVLIIFLMFSSFVVSAITLVAFTHIILASQAITGLKYKY